MVPAAEIDALYESTLKPRLQALEGLRREVRTYIIKAALFVVPPALFLWANDAVALALPDGLGWLPMVLGILGVLAGVTIAGMKYLMPGAAAHTNYRVRYKHEVAAEVFKIVCPTAQYAPLEGISEKIFDEPGLFNARGGFSSDDRVRGVIGQTPFEAADASRSYSTGGKNSTTVVVFRGLFFHLDFNKRMNGRTFVDPKSGGASPGDRSNLTEVTLENAAFAEQFDVYTTDEVEARYILTPAMMERILAVAAMGGKRVHVAFANHRAYLGVHYGRALFEPAIRDSTSVAAIHEMAAHFALAEGIVEELDLNTRIWTKDVDASLLQHAPDEAPKDDLLELAKGGHLTADKIWEVAVAAQAALEGDATTEADAVAPPDSSIRIERGTGTAAVHYGLGLGWVFSLVFWAASVAFTIEGARLLALEIPVRSLAAVAASLPQISLVTPLVATLPIAFLFFSMMLGPFLFLMWAIRVRRVEIAPDAVRIWRGLRPVPRVYERPLYGKVVLLKETVYVGRTQGFSLVNASASPMLSPEEARWVAAEMRRAMRETAQPSLR